MRETDMKTATKGRRAAGVAVEKVNIYDVARAAGVSIATISRAMNNREVVSSDTLRQIDRAMKELRYRPNLNARNLAQQKSNLITVLLSPRDEIHFSQVIMSMLVGIIRGAEKTQKRVTVHLLVRPEEEERLWENATDMEGAIVLNYMKKTAVIRDLELRGMPILYVNCTDDRRKHRVNVDDRAGASWVMEYLIGLGHRRIALLTGELASISGLARLRGCEDVLRRHRLMDEIESARWIRNARFDQKIAHSETMDILKHEPRPTAIFAASDWMAMGVLTAIREKGLRVPGDISVIGYDDTILASQITPSLSTVHQPFIEMGQEAVDGLIQIEEKEDMKVYSKILSPRLIERESSGPPPA